MDDLLLMLLATDQLDEVLCEKKRCKSCGKKIDYNDPSDYCEECEKENEEEIKLTYNKKY